MAKILFRLINHKNSVMGNLTKFKFDCLQSNFVENYSIYKFSHLGFYSEIGNIIEKIPLVNLDYIITHTENFFMSIILQYVN